MFSKAPLVTHLSSMVGESLMIHLNCFWKPQALKMWCLLLKDQDILASLSAGNDVGGGGR